MAGETDNIDAYAGIAGSFINDPVTATRIPIDEYNTTKQEPSATPVKAPITNEEKL
jgi:hypothetical protein